MAEDFDLQTKLDFLKIDTDARESIQAFRALADSHLEEILTHFYSHIMARPNLAAMLGSEDKVRRVRNAQKSHWLTLLQGKFDSDYEARCQRIGEAHFKHNLSQSWYMGGYCFALNELIGLAVDHYRDDPETMKSMIAAVIKAVFLDMDLALSVYQQSADSGRQKTVERLIEAFEETSKARLDESAKAGGDLEEIARTMQGISQRTAEQTSAVAAAAEEASTNVQTMSSATEELTSAIGEVSQQVTRSSEIAGNAASEATQTSQTMATLEEATTSIGQIVGLIKDIAAQTNLLALNATIEAARAGHEGRGFAVVAQEVKSLAGQTAKATDEIGSQIQSVQDVSGQAVTAISSISNTITNMNEIAGSVAASMEEQRAAIDEVSRNAQEAATGTTEVSRNVTMVSDDASKTLETAEGLSAMASSLNQSSEELYKAINEFLDGVKAA